MTSDGGIQYDPIQNSIRQIIGFKGRANCQKADCQNSYCSKAGIFLISWDCLLETWDR